MYIVDKMLNGNNKILTDSNFNKLVPSPSGRPARAGTDGGWGEAIDQSTFEL